MLYFLQNYNSFIKRAQYLMLNFQLLSSHKEKK